jgi:hypothetical protein
MIKSSKVHCIGSSADSTLRSISPGSGYLANSARQRLRAATKRHPRPCCPSLVSGTTPGGAGNAVKAVFGVIFSRKTATGRTLPDAPVGRRSGA